MVLGVWGRGGRQGCVCQKQKKKSRTKKDAEALKAVGLLVYIADRRGDKGLRATTVGSTFPNLLVPFCLTRNYVQSESS